jgi:hypothetical protein
MILLDYRKRALRLAELCLGKRKCQLERRTMAFFTENRNLHMMNLCDPLCNWQTQSGSFNLAPRQVSAVEAIEDMRQVCRSDTDYHCRAQ